MSLAILGDDNPSWRVDRFEYELWGCSLAFQFPIVKLLDCAADWDELESNPNPFATVVMAHRRTQETRKDLEKRREWKMRLVKGLYQQGKSREDIRRLFRFIDWLMTLPRDLEKSFWIEFQAFEEDRSMPYVTSVERIGMEKGLLKGIELGLELKLGPDGLRLLPEIKEQSDLEVLNSILEGIKTASSPDELRRIWAK